MRFLIVAIALFISATGSACTTFFIQKNGEMVLGKNYDWMTPTGMIHTNLRGMLKTSLPLDDTKTFQWTSQYGSTTFNQFGKEFPNGGMNEKGLVIELMWLSDSRFPPKDNRPALSVLQWIQYQLDRHSTVEEVINSDKAVRIVSLGTPQHYLVADAKGNVATIEFIDGKMVVHRDAAMPYPVLANDTYAASLNSYRSNRSLVNSQDRFANACTMVQQYQANDVPTPVVDYSFDILQKVAQPNFTQWSIVYDIRHKNIHFKVNGRREARVIETGRFDYSPNAAPLSLALNDPFNGNVNNRFTPYSSSQNAACIFRAVKESAQRLTIESGLPKKLASWADRVKRYF